MHPHAQIALERERGVLVLCLGADGDGGVAVESAHVDGAVALGRDLLLEPFDRGAEIG